MKSKPRATETNSGKQSAPIGTSEGDQITQNIEAVLGFYTREDEKISASQRALERFTFYMGQPFSLGVIIFFVVGWIATSEIMHMFGTIEFDPAPYFWLQGILALGAFLVATSVLITQNRFAKLAEQREHLDLKVTLLTEQKVAKLIDLIEELRRDMPNVKDRHDPAAAALRESMKPDQVLAALDERGVIDHTARPN